MKNIIKLPIGQADFKEIIHVGQVSEMVELGIWSKLKYEASDGDYMEIPTILSPMGMISQDFSKLPIKQAVDNINGTFATLNKDLPVLMPKLIDTAATTNAILQENRRVTNETIKNLNQAAKNISNAAQSFGNLSDYIERHPDALLKGKKK